MNEKVSEKLSFLFQQQNGIARTKDIVRLGITTYIIRKLVDKGDLIRIKQGLYRKADFQQKYGNDEFVEASKLVPKGVICLLSALSYYELTTYNPWEHYIAIPRDSKKPKLPDYPPIKIIYFSENQYKTGITETEIEGVNVNIYDREKTICDIVRYRDRLGMDIAKEGLQNYLQSPHKNINKLMIYAEKLRIRTVLQTYLEVLI